jgi:hypothetical protein
MCFSSQVEVVEVQSLAEVEEVEAWYFCPINLSHLDPTISL